MHKPAEPTNRVPQVIFKWMPVVDLGLIGKIQKMMTRVINTIMRQQSIMQAHT